MWSNLQQTANLVKFTEELLMENFIFCAVMDVFFDWRDDLLEKYNIPWDTVSTDIKNEFDNQFVYNKKNVWNRK